MDGLGVSYALRRNWPSAIATFRLALQQRPEDRATRNNLALAYTLSGEPDKAVPLLQAATTFNLRFSLARLVRSAM